MDFELLDDYVPLQFLRGDVRKNGTRHLIFATGAQLEFLTNAKTWYVNTTFKVIKQPFTQLFSIHAFAKKDGELMQTPLAFVVMSRRRRKDHTSACSVLLSPRFHVDHAYKPLCPTLKRLCGQPQGKSSREFCSAVVRSTSRRLFGETSKQSVYSARTRPTNVSTECVEKR